MASHLGLDEQTLDVSVPTGEMIGTELPCSEIIGLGSLTMVGETAVHLADGTGIDNRFCVPGFLGSDYLCQGIYRCFLTPDVDDLDENGDTEELVVITDALRFHMGSGGVAGHGHMMGRM